MDHYQPPFCGDYFGCLLVTRLLLLYDWLVMNVEYLYAVL